MTGRERIDVGWTDSPPKGFKMLSRHLLTLAFLMGSFVLYYLGLETGATVLFFAGMACEVVFWKRLLRRNRA
jgi:hypothetical protein